jgi:hypothetical protein
MGKLPTNKRLIKEDPLPGPGAYPMPSLILNENKVLSKDSKKCYGKMIFPESRSGRIKTEADPEMRTFGRYVGLPEINFKGDKTFRIDKGYTLSKSPRFVLKMLSEIPGPGT